jgi:hypothetical protein
MALIHDRYDPAFGAAIVDLLERAQVFRVFTSAWFSGALVLLLISIVVCTLDRTPPPACLNGADDQIRTSLGLYDRGLELVEEGSSSQDRLKVIQGGILVAVASLKLGSAVRAVRQSNC